MAKVIAKRTIEEIRAANDVVELVGSYLPLKRAGGTFKCLCPFHKEKTPSFTVNPQRQIFHCFGCGKGGDVFRFLMEYEGVDFAAAARMLAERAGIRLETEEGEREASDKAVLYRIHAELAAFYQRCLKEVGSAEPARQYLAQRDLAGGAAELFQIGYAPDSWDACLRWGEKHGYGPELLEKAGLVVRPEEGSARGRLYDRFRNRLMFPICDEQGRVIGFSGRILAADAKAAKYVNSPETPLFRKSRVLYALDKARRPIVESREAIVCEGQIDVIRCHQAGFATAVASQGTAFTDEHARTLRRYADRLVLVFDPDRAGRTAAVKTAALFVEAGLSVRVASLPDGQDPDLFIRKEGAAGFRAVLNRAQSALAFQVADLRRTEDLRRDDGLLRASRAVLQTIAGCPNEVQKSAMIQEAAGLLGVSPSALQDDLNAILRRGLRRAGAGESSDAPATDAPPHPPEEVALCEHLAALDEEPGLAALVARYLPLAMVSDPACRAIVERCLQAAQNGKPVREALQFLDADPGELHRLSAQVQMAPAKALGEATATDAVKGSILRLWQRRLRAEREGIDARHAERRAQLTYDLDALKRWETGSRVIELETSA